MPELPKISGAEALKIFERLGFHKVRQRGSHVVIRCGDKGTVVPLHSSLAPGTLRGAIRQAGLNVEEFVKAARR